MYRWVVFVHIISGFAFLMAHGVSAGVYFMLKHERSIERIKTLLNLSRSSLGLMLGSLGLILISGIAGGFIGQWWGQWWIWISIVLFFAIYGGMYSLGSRIFNELRAGLGLPGPSYQKPASSLMSDEQAFALLNQINPVLLSIIGFGGIAVIVFLMFFKPI